MWLTSIFGILVLFCAVSSSPVADGEKTCGYESCPKGKDGMINVHIISHTHDDVGWLKTVDQYYYGAKDTIQIAGVQYILDSVIDALLADESRRFIYVETAFFWRWWLQQDDLTHHTVHKLVNEGRLEFISGGWSMNDEATCHYSSIIENFAWGLRKLNDTFKDCGRPKVGWQIDPFGHSREMTSIFSQMGFDGLFLGRIDYQDIATRRSNKTMEMIWESSSTLGSASDIFTGILPNVYWPPSTFCFDLLCADPPIMDDPRLNDYNVDERVDTFIEVVKNQSREYATSELIITMGNDFNYQHAEHWFKNLDKLIKYVNLRQKNGSNINLFYSTPSCYLKALNDANKPWPTKNDDFFPYSSGAHTYWTGFFTSRPSIKRYEREASSFLQVCKQLDALAQLGPLDQDDVTVLREAVGVMQHHDAVTGTERQHVAEDYAQRIHRGIVECQDVVSDGLNKLAGLNPAVEFKFCDLLNISQCDLTENFQEVNVVVWNPLSRSVSPYIRLPVKDGSIVVTGPTGQVKTQLTALPKHTYTIPGRVSVATHELVFRAKLPPVGFVVYNIKYSPNGPRSAATVFTGRSMKKKVPSWTKRANQEEVVIQNEHLSLTFDQATGLLKSLTNLETKDVLAINQTFGYYAGVVGNNSEEHLRASGAYIFRPNCTDQPCFHSLTGNGSYEIVKGPLVQEVRQYITPWIAQVVRLFNNSRHVEFEWQVGPIPIEDGIGKEIVSRFQTDLKTAGTFFTDSNGRQNVKRQINSRSTFNLTLTEPISSNFYPVVSHIYVQDESKGTRLTLLTDRAQGGASLEDGHLELMVHRRLLYDDWLGVSEALNETAFGQGLVARGVHTLLFNKIEKSARKYRLKNVENYFHPSLAFASASGTLTPSTTFSALNTSLPDNVHILSWEQWKGSSILIRLEHLFEKDEDPVLSLPAVIDLQNLTGAAKIRSFREMTLDGNWPLASVHKLQWQKQGADVPSFKNEIPVSKGKKSTDGSTVVTLKPMEIRCFQIEFVQ